jgi:hypothetical protein
MAAESAADSATKEALEYWGYLFEGNKCGTALLNRLLVGVANHIVRKPRLPQCPPSPDPSHGMLHAAC